MCACDDSVSRAEKFRRSIDRLKRDALIGCHPRYFCAQNDVLLGVRITFVLRLTLDKQIRMYPHPTTSVVSREAIFFSQAFWPIPQLTPADTSSTTNNSPQCFTWNTHPKRIPISSFCNQRPTTRSISPLNHVRETILFHVEHCWDQCYLQCYIARKTYRQARRLNAIFSLKSTCYAIF